MPCKVLLIDYRTWNRGVLKPEKVKMAREVVAKYMGEEGMIENPETMRIGSEMKPGKLLTGYEEVTHQSGFM